LSSEQFYNDYWPKQKWLHPRYVGPTIMASVLGYQMITNQKVTVPYNNFIYVFSAGACLGIHLWKGFVDPIYFNLIPRHQFGLIQSYSFPRYFFYTTFFSFESLVTFLNLYPMSEWKGETCTLGNLLTTAFVLNTLNLTCLGINTLKYNLKMHEIEKNAGEGIDTVGVLKPNSQLDMNPDYAKAKSNFYRFHFYSITAAMIAMGCNIGQFWFLSRNYLAALGLIYAIEAYLKANPKV